MFSGNNSLVVWALDFKFSYPVYGSKTNTTFYATEIEKLSAINLSPVSDFAV